MKLISIETQIIKATIDALLLAGYSLSVNDGEETTVYRSIDPDVILAAMRTSDEDYLFVAEWGTPDPAHMWVRFIYGNDDTEAINDYTMNLESVMAPIFKMIEEFESSE